MTKGIVGLLLLANLVLFGWMRWGHVLTVDADTSPVQAELNADRIRLLAPASAPAASPVPPAALTLSPLPVPAASPVPAVAAANGPARAASCAEWGEFSGSDLARAQQALAALSLGDRVGQRVVEHGRGFWVYIPPLKNRAAVERKITQLKQRGVDEYFVVQDDGEWQHTISLGVFKTEEAAQKYLAYLRTRDVRSARVGERQIKLKFTVFIMKDLDTAAMGKIDALRKGFPDSELKATACGN